MKNCTDVVCIHCESYRVFDNTIAATGCKTSLPLFVLQILRQKPLDPSQDAVANDIFPSYEGID